MKADRYLAAAYINEVLKLEGIRALVHWQYSKLIDTVIEFNISKNKFPRKDVTAEVLSLVQQAFGCAPHESNYDSGEQRHAWHLTDHRKFVVLHTLKRSTYIQLIDTEAS
jgi:hypothetical protein